MQAIRPTKRPPNLHRDQLSAKRKHCLTTNSPDGAPITHAFGLIWAAEWGVRGTDCHSDPLFLFPSIGKSAVSLARQLQFIRWTNFLPILDTKNEGRKGETNGCGSGPCALLRRGLFLGAESECWFAADLQRSQQSAGCNCESFKPHVQGKWKRQELLSSPCHRSAKCQAKKSSRIQPPARDGLVKTDGPTEAASKAAEGRDPDCTRIGRVHRWRGGGGECRAKTNGCGGGLSSLVAASLTEGRGAESLL